jgi:hypothetical protein
LFEKIWRWSRDGCCRDKKLPSRGEDQRLSVLEETECVYQQNAITGRPCNKRQKYFTVAVRFQSHAADGEKEIFSVSKLSAFGLLSVTAMLLFYALEKRSPRFIFAFAVACAMGSVYGFLQGAWPFGLVEAIWSVVALHRWRQAGAAKDK